MMHGPINITICVFVESDWTDVSLLLPCALLSLTSLFQHPALFWNNGISFLSLADTCPLIAGKGVCVSAFFFFQNYFPKPEQSNYRLWHILTNTLDVGLVLVGLPEVVPRLVNVCYLNCVSIVRAESL